MPRPLGVLLIAAASLLVGVYAWFGLVWPLSAGAKLTDARGFDIAMLIFAPHMAGWLIALLLAVIAFVSGLRLARKRHISWLGFTADTASNQTPANQASPPPR